MTTETLTIYRETIDLKTGRVTHYTAQASTEPTAECRTYSLLYGGYISPWTEQQGERRGTNN